MKTENKVCVTSINDTLIKNSVESFMASTLVNIFSITFGIIPPLPSSPV